MGTKPKLKYLTRAIDKPEQLKETLIKDFEYNKEFYNEFIEETLKYGEPFETSVHTYVSNYSGWRMSSEFLKLLHIRHKQDEAIEVIDDILHELNKELDEVLKDFPDYAGYEIYHYFGFLEDSGVCLVQSIKRVGSNL